MNCKLRLRFSKTGKARYISHLDLMATMRRALLRAGVDLKYSEGFNPHPYMSIALPLSVGCGSICELMDIGTTFDLLPDGLPEIINAVLPEGLDVINVYKSERKFNNIAWIEISGVLYYDAGVPPSAVERLTKRFGEKSIVVSKKTKSGISDIDISPYIQGISFIQRDEVMMSAKLSAQNPSINPENLMSALTGDYESLKPDFHNFTRKEVFDKDMCVFQ